MVETVASGRFMAINRFKLLPLKVKVLLVSITIIFTLAILLSIPTLLQHTIHNNGYKETLDPHSGQIIASSNAHPENYGKPQAMPLSIGYESLINHGMSFDKSTQVALVLAAYYQHKNVTEHSNVKLVSIGKDLNHYNDSSDTYSIYDTTIKLDDNNNLIPLRIKDLNDMSKYHFLIQLKLGGDYQTIYETNDDISQFVQ